MAVSASAAPKLKFTRSEWANLTVDERRQVIAQRWEAAKAQRAEKSAKEREKAEHDRYIAAHPNGLISVISQEEADRRNALRAKNAKSLERVDKALGIVRKPILPGVRHRDDLSRPSPAPAPVAASV